MEGLVGMLYRQRVRHVDVIGDVVSLEHVVGYAKA